MFEIAKGRAAAAGGCVFNIPKALAEVLIIRKGRAAAKHSPGAVGVGMSTWLYSHFRVYANACFCDIMGL